MVMRRGVQVGAVGKIAVRIKMQINICLFAVKIRVETYKVFLLSIFIGYKCARR